MAPLRACQALDAAPAGRGTQKSMSSAPDSVFAAVEQALPAPSVAVALGVQTMFLAVALVLTVPLVRPPSVTVIVAPLCASVPENVAVAVVM